MPWSVAAYHAPSATSNAAGVPGTRPARFHFPSGSAAVYRSPSAVMPARRPSGSESTQTYRGARLRSREVPVTPISRTAPDADSHAMAGADSRSSAARVADPHRSAAGHDDACWLPGVRRAVVVAGGLDVLGERELPSIEIVRNLRSIAGTSRARYALVVAALALFGLLSMHGWGTHAGMHADTSHSSAHVALPLGDNHVSVLATWHRGQAAGDAAAMDADPVACADGCGGSGSDGGMGLVGLCLAVLSGLVLAFTLLLLRRCIPLLRTMLPTFRHPVLLSRERAPPDLLRLCVIRC